MPNPLKNLHFKNEFSISSRIFLQKVAQKIEQKNAQQAHMTINQYLITKGTETTPLILTPDEQLRMRKTTSAAQVLKIAIRWYILPKSSVYLRRTGICLTLDLSCGMFCGIVMQS